MLPGTAAADLVVQAFRITPDSPDDDSSVSLPY